MSTDDSGYRQEHEHTRVDRCDPPHPGSTGRLRVESSALADTTGHDTPKGGPDDRRDHALDPTGAADHHLDRSPAPLPPLIHAAFVRRPDHPGDWVGIATICGVDGPQEDRAEGFRLVTCQDCKNILVHHYPRAAQHLIAKPTSFPSVHVGLL